MVTKVIKEIITDVGGNTTIEYSDDTTQKYNVADVVTAQSNPVTGGIESLFAAGISVLTNLDTNSQSSRRLFSDSLQVQYYDPLTRPPTLVAAAGTAIRGLNNNYSGGVVVNGAYSLNASGSTKTSADASSLLYLDEKISDVDIEVQLGSLFSANDSNNCLWLFDQDATHYCYVNILSNTSTASANLAVRENSGAGEVTLGTYGGIYADATNTKFSNSAPTIRAIVRGNLLTVALNGVRVLNNIKLTNLWGKHGIRHFKQNSVLKNLIVRSPQKAFRPSVKLLWKSSLYGDGSKYVGWADCATLNDGTVLIVWRESPLNTPQGGHAQGGSIKLARWKNGTLIDAPVTLYSAAGNATSDIEEQDCILSRVVYNGLDYLVLMTRTYVGSTLTNRTYSSVCNISSNSPMITSNWSSRTEVSFPTYLVGTVGHSHVIPASDGIGYLAGFYGDRVGDTSQSAMLLAYSTDLLNWSYRSMIVDTLAAINPCVGGDFEPEIVRVGGSIGRSLFCYGRGRTVTSPDDGLTWNQYDIQGAKTGSIGTHFAGAIQTPQGAALMYRAITSPGQPGIHRIMPMQTHDGSYYHPDDWGNGLELDRQLDGSTTPGMANASGDGGCLRAADIGGGRYLVTNYKQTTTEMAPRLYQYIVEFSA